ncbi:MAG: hypothetical protein JNK08_11960 [Sediminibacterium sp.]|nr:hypothetical protein [Sediminibacterium sp.]
MRLILFLAIVGGIASLSCKAPQKSAVNQAKQGISGRVAEAVGNQMPRVGQAPPEPVPYPTTVFFYEPTNIRQASQVESAPLFNAIYTRLVATVQTDSAGVFTQSLPVGTYSVFVQVGQHFFANQFDIRNNISLVTVETGKLTDIKIVVNHAAAY